MRYILFNQSMDAFQPTGECFVGAASNGDQVLDDVLAVGGLATTTLAQQDDGLILSSGQEVPIGSLGHAVNVRGSVLPSAALEHLHHLERRQRGREGEEERGGHNHRGEVVHINYYFHPDPAIT